MRATRARMVQAQEKPEREAQPERAPAGMGLAELPARRRLAADTFFCTLGLPQWSQTMVSAALEVMIFSNERLHSRQRYS